MHEPRWIQIHFLRQMHYQELRNPAIDPRIFLLRLPKISMSPLKATRQALPHPVQYQPAPKPDGDQKPRADEIYGKGSQKMALPNLWRNHLHSQRILFKLPPKLNGFYTYKSVRI